MSTSKRKRPFRVGDKVGSTGNSRYTYVITETYGRYCTVKELTSGNEFPRILKTLLFHL